MIEHKILAFQGCGSAWDRICVLRGDWIDAEIDAWGWHPKDPIDDFVC